jgi:hypothetical protein
MALVVIPDLTADPAPSLARIRAAELALVQALGGVHEGVRYQGDLDAANVAAGSWFTLSQQKEPRARVAIGTGRGSRLVTDPGMPSIAEPEALVFITRPVSLDSLQLWHSDPSSLTGTLPVYRNGIPVTELTLPSAGVAAGAILELPFLFDALSGDCFDFRWLNGTSSLTTTGGVAPSPYSRLYVMLFGAISHVG